MKLAEIEQAAHLIHRYRSIRRAIKSLSNVVSVDNIRMKICCTGQENPSILYGNRDIAVMFYGSDVAEIKEHLRVLLVYIENMLLSYGVSVGEIEE